MKISGKIQEAINKQINYELFSSYLYLSMSAYFESINFKGFAHWMKLQAQEELGHAMKFYLYLNDRGGNVELQVIDKPKNSWGSHLEVFQETYEHEQKITQSINELSELAGAEKDRATIVFLEWFITEQVEEEASADEIVQKLKMIKDAPGGLFLLDRELAARVLNQQGH